MLRIQNSLPGVVVLALAMGIPSPALADPHATEQWQATYSARAKYFEKAVGPLPGDILKMLNMTGVWPGGGLFVIPAPRLGKDLAVYTTFGLSNPDMPATAQSTQFELRGEEHRATRAQTTLQSKQPAPHREGAAGYGYELVVVAGDKQEWPLGLVQWAVNAEIIHDAGLLERVEKYSGITVENIDTAGGPLNVLIARAAAPLPTGLQLPDGHMDVLVATTITEEEMRWSMKNGRPALLQKLREGGVGQISRPGRESVVH
jgi:hypothetical protein